MFDPEKMFIIVILSSHAAQEVERVLRTLKSPKAPIAKKRQVMRATFGDYRSKMLQEEKKHLAGESWEVLRL